MMGLPFLHGLEGPIGNAFGKAVSWLAQTDVMALVQHIKG